MTQYFWPEQFRVNDLVTDLTRRGHRVEVLTGYPNYPGGTLFPGYRMRGAMRENFGDAPVTRVPLWPRHDGSGRHLVANYLSLAATATAFGPFVLRRDIDVVLVYEPSPLTIAVPGLALARARGVPVVLWVQDLWPDTLFAMKVTASRRMRSVATRASGALHKRMDHVLIQSHAMEAPLTAQGVEPSRIHYVPNWAPEQIGPRPRDDAPPYGNELPSGFVLLFAGNIGQAQSLDTVLDAAELVRDVADLHWVILGEGRRLSWLREQVAERSLTATVHLLGHMPPETMPDWFALADALLLTLRADPVYELTVPSKLQAYLASGKPVLAALSGEGARIVQESGAGVTVSAGDGPALARAARALYGLDPARLEAMGAAGRQYSNANFDRTRLTTRIEELLVDAIGSPKPRSRRRSRTR